MKEYKMKNFSVEKMNNNCFTMSQAFSSEDSVAYVRTYPVYKYYDMGVLEARIIVWNDGQVRIDIMDRASRGFYAPWYTESPDRWVILNSVEENLNKILKKLEIKEHGRKNKKNKQKRKNTNKEKQD